MKSTFKNIMKNSSVRKSVFILTTLALTIVLFLGTTGIALAESATGNG